MRRYLGLHLAVLENAQFAGSLVKLDVIVAGFEQSAIDRHIISDSDMLLFCFAFVARECADRNKAADYNRGKNSLHETFHRCFPPSCSNPPSPITALEFEVRFVQL